MVNFFESLSSLVCVCSVCVCLGSRYKALQTLIPHSNTKFLTYDDRGCACVYEDLHGY